MKMKRVCRFAVYPFFDSTNIDDSLMLKPDKN